MTLLLHRGRSLTRNHTLVFFSKLSLATRPTANAAYAATSTRCGALSLPKLLSLSNYQNGQRLSNCGYRMTWFSRSMSEKSSSGSNCRQFFHPDCEEAINKQIHQELCASFVYLSMAYYFDRDDVALKGFHEFFRKSSKEETTHAEMLMKYQNSRGGRILLRSIDNPAKDEWGSPVDAISEALSLEKAVNESLKNVHAVASKHEDYHLENFMEECMIEQVSAIKMLADYLTNLRRVGSGLGEYIFEKDEFPKAPGGSD